MAETLGETFRERRRQLGVSLEQAEQALNIRARILDDLESGAYDRLPNPGYVRVYVSSYARYLELDTDQMLTMYHAETGHGRFHRIELPDQAVKPRHEQHALPWRSAVAVVAVIALLSLAIWGVARLVSGPESTPPVPASPEPSTVATGNAGAGGQETSPTVEATKPPEPVTKAFVLDVRVAQGESSWLAVTIDGKKAYEGITSGPDTQRYTAKDSAEVRIGRVKAVTVLRDGKEQQPKLDNGIGVVTLDATAR